MLIRTSVLPGFFTFTNHRLTLRATFRDLKSVVNGKIVVFVAIEDEVFHGGGVEKEVIGIIETYMK